MRYGPSHAYPSLCAFPEPRARALRLPALCFRLPRSRALCSVALGLLALGSAGAQGQIPVETGREVRLWLDGDEPGIEGMVTALDGGVLSVAEDRGPVRRVSTSDVSFAEVNVYRGNTLRGAMIGGGIGLLGGLLVVATSDDGCDREADPLCDVLVGTANTIVLLWAPVAGALTGALVGMAVRSDRWVPAVLPRSAPSSLSLVWRAPR